MATTKTTSTVTEPYRKRHKALRSILETQGWKQHYKELVDYLQPRKGRFLISDSLDEKRGAKKHGNIINGTAGEAIKIIASGLQGGLTSPSRPWFVLTTADDTLAELQPVRQWLHTLRNRMMYVFARSNFYGAVHNIYSELAPFGTAAMIIDEDTTKVIRCRPFTIGEYVLGQNSQFSVDTLYRIIELTPWQMVDMFTFESCSKSVQTAYNNKSEKPVKIVHCIQPKQRGSMLRLPASMIYESVYYEYHGTPDRFLRVKGYADKPFVAPRWQVSGTNVYGDAPGMDVLGDVKMLQSMEKKKLKALDKMVDPPMNAPSSMRAQGGTIVSGGVNYLDVQQGQQGFTPVYQVKPDLQNMAFEIDRVEKRIQRGFYNDLFLAIINMDDRQRTATEIAKLYEEKAQVLGPVLEGLQSELLEPAINRTYNVMLRFGLVPPAPPELEGQDLKVDYISILAQAQKAVGTVGIEKTIEFVGALASISPSVIDKFDADEAVDSYSVMVGVPPKIIRSNKDVAAIRQQRAQQQQAMAMQEQLRNAAETAKTASETPVGDKSMLEVVTGSPT